MKVFQQMSIKARYLVFNILMSIGAFFAAIKIIYDYFTPNQDTFLSWMLILAFVFFILGFIFRLTMVKCPFCGNNLTEFKKAPDMCPICRESAYRWYFPENQEDKAEDKL